MKPARNKFDALALSDSEDEKAGPVMSNREAKLRAAKLISKSTKPTFPVSAAQKMKPVAATDLKTVPFYTEKKEKVKKPAKTKAGSKTDATNDEKDVPKFSAPGPNSLNSDDEALNEVMAESRRAYDLENQQKLEQDADLELALQRSIASALSVEVNTAASSVHSEISNHDQVLESKEIEQLKMLLELRDAETTKLQEKLDRYKLRVRLCLQLLNDVEYKDKAQILVENSRLKETNEDISSSLALVNVELETLKSRNHELERELRKYSVSK